MKGFPHVDCDHCQFSDYGYQKPTRFFGSDHLLKIPSVECKQETCKYLVEIPGREGHRPHINRQGGKHGCVKREKAYRIPPAMVEYVTGLVRDAGHVPAVENEVSA